MFLIGLHSVHGLHLIADINECSLEGDGFCDQGCNNTVGSFSCSCSEGFELNSDGLSCNGELNSG